MSDIVDINKLLEKRWQRDSESERQQQQQQQQLFGQRDGRVPAEMDDDDLEEGQGTNWLASKPIETYAKKWLTEEQFEKLWQQQGLVYALAQFHEVLSANGLKFGPPSRFLKELGHILRRFLVDGEWQGDPKKLNKPSPTGQMRWW